MFVSQSLVAKGYREKRLLEERGRDRGQEMKRKKDELAGKINATNIYIN